jgi:hypothetical protein
LADSCLLQLQQLRPQLLHRRPHFFQLGLKAIELPHGIDQLGAGDLELGAQGGYRQLLAFFGWGFSFSRLHLRSPLAGPQELWNFPCLLHPLIWGIEKLAQVTILDRV